MDNLEEEFRNKASAVEEIDSFICLDTLEEVDKRKRRSPVDYEAMRLKYILGKQELREDGVVLTTDYTYETIAAEFNAYLPSVKIRGGKEKWSIQRAAYRARVKENAENTALNIYLHEGAIADTHAMIATNKLNKIYKMALSKYDSIIEAYDTNRELDEEEIIDVKELKDLLAIGKDLHNLSQQVVKSRSAVVERDIVKDLQTYKLQAQQQKPKIDSKAIETRISQLQNILAAAKPNE